MLKDLLLQDRSYRGFDESRKITREELTEFVDDARYAPSSVNMQPFCYYLACTEEDVKKIQPLTGWARALPQMTLPHPGHRPTAFIVIFQDTERFGPLPRFQRDVGIVAHTMLLAAVEKGLGGCMIGNFDAAQVREALGLSETLTPVLIVAFGKPDETVVLTETGPDGSTDYYRDENDVHYVPKRPLRDLLLNP